MAIIKRAKRRRYSSISNDLLQDPSISFGCRGMLAYLLSKPDDWECSMNDIEREGGIKETARRALMIEAEKAGYLCFHRRRDHGKFVSCYDVHEQPVEETERTQSWLTGKTAVTPPPDFPGVESPGVENPAPGKPALDEPPVGEPSPENLGDIQRTEVQITDLQKTDKQNPVQPSASQARKLSNVKDQAGKKARKDDPMYAVFAVSYQKAYGQPYLHKEADFVQLRSLVNKCEESNWPLTVERFSVGLKNYFQSPMGDHTLADLSARFSAFFRGPLDQYGKPTKQGGKGKQSAEAYVGASQSETVGTVTRAVLRPRTGNWGKVLDLLAGAITDEAIATWFEPMSEVRAEDGVLYLNAPAALFQEFIKNNYADQFKQAGLNAGFSAIEIETFGIQAESSQEAA